VEGVTVVSVVVMVAGRAKQYSGAVPLYPQTTCFPPQYARPFPLPSAVFRQVQPDAHFCGGTGVGVVVTIWNPVTMICGTAAVVAGFS
jgi:hypothetical protein